MNKQNIIHEGRTFENACVNVLADVFARETGKEITDSRILILEDTIDHMMTKTM